MMSVPISRRNSLVEEEQPSAGHGHVHRRTHSRNLDRRSNPPSPDRHGSHTCKKQGVGGLVSNAKLNNNGHHRHHQLLRWNSASKEVFPEQQQQQPPRGSVDRTHRHHNRTSSNESADLYPISVADLSNPQGLDLGPLLLKLARALHLSGEDPLKALECASRAAKFLERSSCGKPSSLQHVSSLHLLAAIYCRLGRLEEAIPVLEQSLAISCSGKEEEDEEGRVNRALAAFAGHMQLGDALALLGRHSTALSSYHSALEIQKSALGESDPQIRETCIYIAEAHLQALQFLEAEEMCQNALRIHGELSQPGSVEEARDRRLMGLILSGKGEFESALKHLILASVSFTSSGNDSDAAETDLSIGDMYVALGHNDEALFSYRKALDQFKAMHGEDHTSVASVHTSLAELYTKTGKLREAKAQCETALRIYSGQNVAGHSRDELASGLCAIASVFESTNEREQALFLLRRAFDILDELPGRQVAAAGAESQMGVLYLALGRYEEAFLALKSAASKLTVGTGKRSALLGVVLNQMGLACVGLNEVWHAVTTFEESRSILEECCGPRHTDTLSVSSNLAGTYDALGRSEDAIELLEGILEVKEERLGTAHPDTEEERQRLMVLLKEVGRTRVHKTNTLEELLLLTTVKSSRYHGS